jgi:hypothetical protein
MRVRSEGPCEAQIPRRFAIIGYLLSLHSSWLFRYACFDSLFCHTPRRQFVWYRLVASVAWRLGVRLSPVRGSRRSHRFTPSAIGR